MCDLKTESYSAKCCWLGFTAAKHCICPHTSAVMFFNEAKQRHHCILSAFFFIISNSQVIMLSKIRMHRKNDLQIFMYCFKCCSIATLKVFFFSPWTSCDSKARRVQETLHLKENSAWETAESQQQLTGSLESMLLPPLIWYTYAEKQTLWCGCFCYNKCKINAKSVGLQINTQTT